MFKQCLVASVAVLVMTGAGAQTATVATGVSQNKSVRVSSAEVEVRGRIVELDKTARTITVSGAKGQATTLDVPEAVKNFDQIQVGDDIVLRYALAVAVSLQPVKGSGIRERVDTAGAGTAPAGSLPAVAGARKVEVLADVTRVNSKTHTVTLRGVKRTVTAFVPEGVDIKTIKVGQQVRAVFVEAVVLDVQRAPAK
jgi:hypothetical protein